MWRGSVGMLASIVTVGTLLVIFLALGGNSPRPLRAPDWQAAGLPIALEAAPGTTAVELLGQSCGGAGVQVEAVPLSGPDTGFNGYGLICYTQDVVSSVVFAVGGDGTYAVLQMVGEEEVPLVDWQQFPHVRRGLQANRLRVTCGDGVCALYINDEYATMVESGDRLGGDVGLWVRSYTDESVSVRFERAWMWK